MTDPDTARRALGYVHAWRSSGLLPDELLAAQHSHFLSPEGDRDATEHYRVAALRHALDARDALTDIEFASLHKVGWAEIRIGGICRHLTGMGPTSSSNSPTGTA